MSHKIETNEQLTAVLELITSQGLILSEAAVKLGVSKSVLARLLNKIPQYVEHRQRIKAKEEENREKVLEMGRSGYTASIIARELGISVNTTYSWLLKAGIDTTVQGSDDLTCPACDGVMKKQELFFWVCDRCNSEWWPKKAPDNPDDWIRPWRIRYEDGGAEMLGIATRMHGEGYSLPEICDELNARGIKTHTGNRWQRSNLSQYLKVRGISVQSGERIKIEEIVRTMAESGYRSKDIAGRLNLEGLMNSHGKNWGSSGITKLSKRIGVDLKVKHKINLKSDCKVHPWTADETARYAKNKAWRRSHDVPIVPMPNGAI